MYHEVRVRKAVFANFERTVQLAPGKDGVGAVVVGWIEASRIYRASVKRFEEATARHEERTAENDIARRLVMRKRKEWYRENDQPDLFEEYRDLKSKTLAFGLRQQRRWKVVKDRGEELDVIFDELAELEADYLRTRTVLEESEGETRDAEMTMRTDMTRITTDHRQAEAQRLPIRDLFPTVHLNDQVIGINGKNLQQLPFAELVEELSNAHPPNRMLVRMYRYVKDAEEDEWVSREDMLASGRFVADLRTGFYQFLAAAREGAMAIVEANIRAGIDVDCTVCDGVTALHLAASTGNEALVARLLEADADVDVEDRNGLTPLHHACMRGDLATAQLLLLRGADPATLDCNGRTPLMVAAAGSHVEVANLLLARDPKQAEQVDNKWEWNALHYAVREGAVDVALSLIDADEFALHMRSTQGHTPLDLARRSRQTEVAEMIVRRKEEARAQQVYSGADGELWLGGEESVAKEWALDVMRFDAIVVVQESYKQRFSTAAWLSDTPLVADYSCTVPNSARDSSPKSWQSLTKELKSVLSFIRRNLQPGKRVLVMDRLGKNTCAAIIVAYMITRKGQNLFPALQHVTRMRPMVQLSESYMKGLDDLEEGWAEAQLRRKDRLLAMAIISSMKF